MCPPTDENRKLNDVANKPIPMANSHFCRARRWCVRPLNTNALRQFRVSRFSARVSAVTA